MDILSFATTLLGVSLVRDILKGVSYLLLFLIGTDRTSVTVRMGYSGPSARKSAWQFLKKAKNPRLNMLEKFVEALNVSLVDLVR